MKSAKILQIFAFVMGAVGCILAFIFGLVYIIKEIYLYGFLILFGGIVGSLVSSAFIYGFGLIVENTTVIREMLTDKKDNAPGETFDLTSKEPEETKEEQQ